MCISILDFRVAGQQIKFADFTQKARSENGLYYITEYANAYVSGKVIQEVDMDTHIMFIAEVPDAVLLSDIPSVTYTYYQDHIKPRPQETPTAEKGKTKWVCRICGFIYEGEELPPDYICPVCKHGVQDFEDNGLKMQMLNISLRK